MVASQPPQATCPVCHTAPYYATPSAILPESAKEGGCGQAATLFQTPRGSANLVVRHAALGHSRRLLLLGDVGDDRLGGQQHGGDGSSVLQPRAGHLERVDHAR